MNNLRVAVAIAGCLIAVIAGAETARWGLEPLLAAQSGPAPEIVSVDAPSAAGSGTNVAGPLEVAAAAQPDSVDDARAPAEPGTVRFAEPDLLAPEPISSADSAVRAMADDGPALGAGIGPDRAGAMAPDEHAPWPGVSDSDDEGAATRPDPD